MGKAHFSLALDRRVGLSCIHPTTRQPPFVANKAQLPGEGTPGEHVQTARELFWPDYESQGVDNVKSPTGSQKFVSTGA